MLYETSVRIYIKSMLIAWDCIKFHRRTACQSFLVNNFAHFLDVVWVKNQDVVQPLVVFGYSNICYSYHTPDN